MPDSPVTLTLPLTQAGAQVLLAALGIALATVLVYLMLDAQGRKPRSDPAMDWLKALGAALVPIWLILLGGTLWHLWLLFDGQASVLGDAGFGMGAVIAAFLGGPFVIWGTVIKQETVKYQKEGHITERISKAVEQLGEEKTVKRDGGEVTVPNIEVRIGGLLSLERIAQDSTQNDKGRDHVRVMEILCAYVRQNAPASEARDFPLPDWEPLKETATDEERKAHISALNERFGKSRVHSQASNWVKHLETPREDVTLAVRILGRRSAAQRQVEAAWPNQPDQSTVWPFGITRPTIPSNWTPQEIEAYRISLEKWRADIEAYSGYRLDLRQSNLQRIDMSAKRQDCSDAVFSGALLDNTHLDGALMDGARLVGIEFNKVSLIGASLCHCQLAESNFEDFCNLEGASLIRSDLVGARFSEAELQGTCFTGVTADFAMIDSSNLDHGLTVKALFRCASFSATSFHNASFRQTDFSFSEFDKMRWVAPSSFRKCHFDFAGFYEIDLSKFSIGFLDWDRCFADASVVIPQEITRPATWPEWKLPRINANNFSDEYQKWLSNPAAYTPPPPPGD